MATLWARHTGVARIPTAQVHRPCGQQVRKFAPASFGHRLTEEPGLFLGSNVDPLAQRVDSWRNLQAAPYCIHSRSGTEAGILNRPVPPGRSAALLIGPWDALPRFPSPDPLPMCLPWGARPDLACCVRAVGEHTVPSARAPTGAVEAAALLRC
jgi:hypothetical protein